MLLRLQYQNTQNSLLWPKTCRFRLDSRKCAKKAYDIETGLRHLETIGLLETFRFRYLLQNQLPRISHHEKSNTSEIQKSPERGSFSIRFKRGNIQTSKSGRELLCIFWNKKNLLRKLRKFLETESQILQTF